jgi:hypothetical protein
MKDQPAHFILPINVLLGLQTAKSKLLVIILLPAFLPIVSFHFFCSAQFFCLAFRMS